MANNFSSETNLEGQYRFESGALTTDTTGNGNTLTDNNTVQTSTGDYQEGAACADCEYSNSEYFSIADGSVSADFPLKSGTTNKTFTICGRFKAEALTAASCTLVSKYRPITNGRSFFIGVEQSSSKFYVGFGYNSGNSVELKYFNYGEAGASIQTGRWYHFAVCVDDTDKSFFIRIWDETAGDYLFDDVDSNYTNALYLSSVVHFGIGGRPTDGLYWDGLIDEFLFFSRYLTPDEIDQIRLQVFPTTLVSALTLTAEAEINAVTLAYDYQLDVAPLTGGAILLPSTVFAGQLVEASIIEAAASLLSVIVGIDQFDLSQYESYAFRYYFTLTGAADSLDDVVIPISSFSVRLKSGTPSYLQVVIPAGDDYADDVAARPNGDMVVSIGVVVGGAVIQTISLATVDLEDVRIDYGKYGSTITLVGHRTVTTGGAARTLTGANYKNDSGGVLRYRFGLPDLYVRPGDTVTVGNDTFNVSEIAINISDGNQSMEIAEAD